MSFLFGFRRTPTSLAIFFCFCLSAPFIVDETASAQRQSVRSIPGQNVAGISSTVQNTVATYWTYNKCLVHPLVTKMLRQVTDREIYLNVTLKEMYRLKQTLQRVTYMKRVEEGGKRVWWDTDGQKGGGGSTNEKKCKDVLQTYTVHDIVFFK